MFAMTRAASPKRRLTCFAAALVTASLIAASCGSDDARDDSPTTTAEADPDAPDTADGDDEATATTIDPTPVITEPPASEFEPVYGGKIVVGIEAETMGPWRPGTVQCDQSCHIRARTFYDALMVTNDDLEPEPFLLESMEANEDDTLFTLKVREGITFHDGSELNADVVIDNLQRTFGGLVVSTSMKDLARDPDGNVIMEKLDDMTFTIATGLDGNPDEPVPWPLLPFSLAGQAGLIASSEWLAAVDAGTADETRAVGTGPFMLSHYAPGDRLTVVRNDNYWLTDANGNQLPYLDEIEFRVITDDQVRAQALRSGELDLITTSSAAVVTDLSQDASLDFAIQDQFAESHHLMLNLTKPYFQDRDVRCALTQAIDREELIDIVAPGATAPLVSPFTPGQEGYIADLEGQPFDPDAAREAIAAWEAENGPLTIRLSSVPWVSNMLIAQYLDAAWGDIGVDVIIDQVEQSTLIANALFGDENFDIYIWRSLSGMFLESQTAWWHGRGATPPPGLAINFGRLDDPLINDRLDAVRPVTDPEVRRQMAEDVNHRFVDECYLIALYPANWGIHFNPAIQNIGRTPTPDGEGFVRDGAGFPGQIWFNAMFLAN